MKNKQFYLEITPFSYFRNDTGFAISFITICVPGWHSWLFNICKYGDMTFLVLLFGALKIRIND